MAAVDTSKVSCSFSIYDLRSLLIFMIKCLLPRRSVNRERVCIFLRIWKYNTKLLRFQRHSIHGMMEEENVVRPHQEMASLSLQEKKYLLAVERGDVASVRRWVKIYGNEIYILSVLSFFTSYSEGKKRKKRRRILREFISCSLLLTIISSLYII